MKTVIAIVLTILLVAASLLSQGQAQEKEKYWANWRGPLMTGVAPNGTPPVTWSEEKNVRWKREIPGRGLATPVIWGGNLYVLTSFKKSDTPDKVAFAIMTLKRADGEVVWQKTLREEVPHEGTHRDGSFASNSAVTDGEVVFAYFGSRGLFCLDLSGKVLWEKDLGDMHTRRGFGEGSSPALFDDTLVINWDHEGDSFIVAFDKKTGKELWRKERDEPTSWATPLVIEVGGKPQVVINATNRSRAYDLKTGEIIWEAGGMTANTIPSPVHKDGMVYLMSGFRGNMLQAIRLADAKGDIGGSDAIVWELQRDTPYVPSPLLYGDYLYFLKGNSGILSCFNALTGEANYGPVRLEGVPNVYASPVGADGRVYIAGRDGTVLVIEQGAEYKVLASNTLDDRFDASPAIAGGELYLRGHNNLYCIAEK